MNKTYLNKFHHDHGGQMVDFSGWEMPINYGSQINEHNTVREDVGLFDVSHMAVFDFVGDNQKDFFKYLIPNDVEKILDHKRALYTPLLNHDGKILDDLIVYHKGDENFRIISNCATRNQNNKWFKEIASKFSVDVNFHQDASIIAVQGPNSTDYISQYLDVELKQFHLHETDQFMIAKTGYTGELGYEIVSTQEDGIRLWDGLIERGVKPIGLAARDTLRLEAGLNLYGVDMSLDNHPYESNLGWTIDMNDESREFIGKNALLELKESQTKLIGFYTNERGVLRAGTEIAFEGGTGKITSGTWSPTFKKNIGFCRVTNQTAEFGTALLRDKEIILQFCETNFLKYLK